ncbi:GntR family transcriptional regulator [Planotetraspora sp. A-T 1434]|uniref:GntR family transcriptional regulator n=1 Tax=Planotetraspora sp. A-T 1434 TaxID=2979219 RepID=UPI0021C169D8|nr:GntR family transcriptional regulator [Planotetraspora sp. A-T 1434]MCT9930980.1 GntR family transcriptional regulator [Planotetraspora sp. A-T 1434]
MLEAVSLVELSMNRLREEILSGALQPGERLVEEQLTRRFGISRAPLREALRLLDEQGLVEHLPRRGARVAQLSERDVDELFALRDVLERYAVGEALPVADPSRLADLETALAAMAAAAEAGDLREENDAHCRFHLAMVGLAGSRQLLLAYQPVIRKLQLYMAANLRRETEHLGDPADGVRRHRRLFEAVATGGPETALQVLATHGARIYIG